MFWTLLGYTVAKAWTSPRNSSPDRFSLWERVGSGDETRFDPCEWHQFLYENKPTPRITKNLLPIEDQEVGYVNVCNGVA